MSPYRKWLNTQENVFGPPRSDHIQGETLFQTILDQETDTGSSFAENQNGKFGGDGQKDLHAGRSGKNEDYGV